MRYRKKTQKASKLNTKRREFQTMKFIMRQLINKNGAVCGICGKEITDMKDCTIDHIKPRALGGLTVIENCQLAHLKCNQKKGDSYNGD